MKSLFTISFIMIGATILIAVVISLLCNWATAEEDKEHARKRKEIEESILPNWSLENAKKVNRETAYYDPDNIRLIKGLYRTPEEADKYIEESLEKTLP